MTIRVRLEKPHVRGCYTRKSPHPAFICQPWNDAHPKREYEQPTGRGAGTWLRFMCNDTACDSTALVNRHDLAAYITRAVKR